MVETMTAYENYEYNMNLIEDMFRHIATTAFGRTEFKVRGHVIDFSQPWRRVSMADAVKEKTGVDFREIKTVDEANARLAALGINEPQPSIGEALVKAFEGVEPDLIQPTLVYGHPVEISPLAKPMAEDPRFVERFEIFIAGMECGDNWSEQNDPAHLLETWQKSYRADERDSGKFHTLDFDFIEALEYGMPPTTGIGPGIERMAMIFTEQEIIDDVIFFPMMRPSVSPVNASIYGVAEPTLAPVEDLALSVEDFEALCRDGVLKPHARHLILKPHVRLWSFAPAKSRGSGHVEIEGFLPNSVLRVAGYKLKAEEALSDEEAKKQVLGADGAVAGQVPAGDLPGLPGDRLPRHRAAQRVSREFHAKSRAEASYQPACDQKRLIALSGRYVPALRFEDSGAGGGAGGKDGGLPAGLLLVGRVQRCG